MIFKVDALCIYDIRSPLNYKKEEMNYSNWVQNVFVVFNFLSTFNIIHEFCNCRAVETCSSNAKFTQGMFFLYFCLVFYLVCHVFCVVDHCK